MKKRNNCLISISPTFFLLIGLFFLMDKQGLLSQILLAAAAHEIGHVAAVYLVGGEIAQFRLTMFGGELQLLHPERLSYGRELLAVLAGPGTNILCAVVLSRFAGGELLDIIVGVHLLLGLFNLLPVRFLDGGRAMELLLSWWTEPITADRWLHGINCAALIICWLLTIFIQLRIGPELPMLIVGLWFFICWCAETGIVKTAVCG